MNISKFVHIPRKYELIILVVVIALNFFPINLLHQTIEAGICATDGLDPSLREYQWFLIAACGPERDLDLLFRAGGGLFLGLFFSTLATYSYSKNSRIVFLACVTTTAYQFGEMYLLTNVAYLFNNPVPIGHFLLLFLSASVAFFMARMMPDKASLKFKRITLISEIFLIAFGALVFTFVLNYLLHPYEPTIIFLAVGTAATSWIIHHVYHIKNQSRKKIENNYYHIDLEKNNYFISNQSVSLTVNPSSFIVK